MRRVVFVTVVLMAVFGMVAGCARPGTPASPPASLDYVVERQSGVWTVTGTTNTQWVA